MYEKENFREIRYRKKKKEIIRTAAKAFGASGYHGVSIEQIANKMELTKGSLYYYFTNKEELLYEVHRLSLNEVIKELDIIMKSKKSPEDKLKKAIEAHLKILGEHYEGAYMLQQDYLLPDNYNKEIISLRKSYEQNLFALIEEGLKKKIFFTKDPKITLYCILGAVNWFLRWYSSSGALSIEQIADRFVDFFYKGLLYRSDNTNE
jgi:AcrR family transcriptional regulator